MTALAQVKARQPNWFSRGNKQFFGDVDYRVLQGKATKRAYLVRSTYAWTDMFGQPRTLHYRVNALSDDLKIENLIDTVFEDMDAVKDWLKVN